MPPLSVRGAHLDLHLLDDREERVGLHTKGPKRASRAHPHVLKGGLQALGFSADLGLELLDERMVRVDLQRLLAAHDALSLGVAHGLRRCGEEGVT